MSVPFHVTVLLADAAQAVGGKLYILGGGWSTTGPHPTPSALAIYIKVPWDQANRRHRMRLDLVDSDGNPVEVDSPIGSQPVVVESEIEVGRPPGTAPGTPLDIALAINLGPLPLAPGSRYEWRMTIGGESHEDWRWAFSTRAPGQAPGLLDTA